MDNHFILSCCSTADLLYANMEGRHIPVLFYTYVADGTEYDDDMGRDPAALPRFYGFLKEGKLPQTSQINVAGYMDFFERLLQKGGDVLHIAFTSGQSCSVNNAYLGGDASLACSEQTAAKVDAKVVEIVQAEHRKAYKLLADNKRKLDEIAKYLYEKETISGEEFMRILNAQPQLPAGTSADSTNAVQ